MAPFRPRVISAKVARSSAYTSPSPSLFAGPGALPKSIGQYTGPRADLLDADARKIMADWDAKRADGMFPVLVGASSVEWRKVAA